MALYELTAHELHEKLKGREITALELTQSMYDRIGAVEDQIKGYLTLTEDIALESAAAVDAGFQRGDEMPPLAGIPIAIKDVICTKGVLTTCGSEILGNFVSPYDATVMKKTPSAGSRDARQNEHGRVRDGVIDGELGVPEHAQSVESGNDSRWVKRRLLGGCRCGRSDLLARIRHRRLDSAACCPMRRRGDEANLRTGLTVWVGGVCIVLGSDWTFLKGCNRLRVIAQHNLWA